MSVLLVPLTAGPRTQGALAATVERLIGQGDEVRVGGRPDLVETTRALGAHIAAAALDEDLVERAAINCRTIAVFALDGDPSTEDLHAVVQGGMTAGVDRFVFSGRGVSEPLVSILEKAPTYVALWTEKRTLLRVQRAEPATIAEAVDHADDRAGAPREQIDLVGD